MCVCLCVCVRACLCVCVCDCQSPASLPPTWLHTPGAHMHTHQCVSSLRLLRLMRLLRLCVWAAAGRQHGRSAQPPRPQIRPRRRRRRRKWMRRRRQRRRRRRRPTRRRPGRPGRPRVRPRASGSAAGRRSRRRGGGPEARARSRMQSHQSCRHGRQRLSCQRLPACPALRAPQRLSAGGARASLRFAAVLRRTAIAARKARARALPEAAVSVAPVVQAQQLLRLLLRRLLLLPGAPWCTRLRPVAPCSSLLHLFACCA